jgi:hypothetical protein
MFPRRTSRREVHLRVLRPSLNLHRFCRIDRSNYGLIFRLLRLVRHGYPRVPTDQAHGRPRQVGPTYQKTHRPISKPNGPSWRPTQPPEDLPEDSPDDLIRKTT